MKKVIFLWVTMAFVLGSFALGGVEAVKAQAIELKMAHFMSPMHIQHQKSFVPFTQKVEELTGGKVKIKIYPGGALGRPKQLPDAVKTGVTDIAFIIPSYTTGRFPRISAFDLPSIFDSAVHTTKVVYDLYDKYLAGDFKDYKVLWLYSCGPGHLHSVTSPIETVGDLKGMKLRTPSAYMTKALKLLGANPVGMPISKLQMSLQKKVIDGMLTPWSAVEDFKFWDLIKYLTEVNMYTMPMAVVMNKEKFDSLPDSAKRAIEQASGKQWGLHAAQVYDNHDGNTIKKNNKLGKIKVCKLPRSEIKELNKRLKVMEADWVDEWSKNGLPAKKILKAVHRSAKKNR